MRATTVRVAGSTIASALSSLLSTRSAGDGVSAASAGAALSKPSAMSPSILLMNPPSPSRHDVHGDARRHPLRPVDPLGRFLKIGRPRLINAHELLRITVHQRKPGTLHLQDR